MQSVPRMNPVMTLENCALERLTQIRSRNLLVLIQWIWMKMKRRCFLKPNTRGKKAKRKAREKQLEEARRLASLQKRRELEAAGITIDPCHKKRKWRGIDYNAEIPFEKRPPPGFYDIGDEDRPAELVKFPTTIEELEGERRVDKEARLRKQDVARSKIAERQDAPSAVLQANKLNDPEAVRKRSRLNLPSPQIPDHELEAIAKMGISSDLLRNEELTNGNAAAGALRASYVQTPRLGMTPGRTPQRTPAGKQDAATPGGLNHGKKELVFGMKNLPQPKNDYVIQPLCDGDEDEDEDEDEEPEEEEDMSDRVAREKAEEEARQQDLLKKRSKVLQSELPRPPVASLDLSRNSLMRTGEAKSSNHSEKLVSLQNEFETVKKKMDDETKRAQRHEQKIKVLTNGYQMRANKLWAQIEATFKQMETAGTELECFQALKKQEMLSATHRISNLREEVQKQKDLECTLQKRYDDRLTYWRGHIDRLQAYVNAA